MNGERGGKRGKARECKCVCVGGGWVGGRGGIFYIVQENSKHLTL